jgi:hypothetical protein
MRREAMIDVWYGMVAMQNNVHVCICICMYICKRDVSIGTGTIRREAFIGGRLVYLYVSIHIYMYALTRNDKKE